MLPADLPDPEHADDADPVLDAEVERATARFSGLLPPEALTAMREELRLLVRTHPTTRAYARRLRPPPDVKQSADVPVAGAEEALGVQKKQGGQRE